MIATLLFGQASAEGVQFFQPPVGGFLSQGSMVSQAVQVPLAGSGMNLQPVPYAGNEMALQPIPYVVTEASETEDYTGVFGAASFAVCALAVAGVTLSQQRLRANREQAVHACELQYRRRASVPAMQLQQINAPGAVESTGAVARQRGPVGVDSSILVQGGSLRTWSYRSPAVEQVQVVLGTEGRPLDADIELWHGPDNTPVKMRVYCENGQLRPFSAVIETPRGPNTVAIRNIGQIEFPIAADVVAQDVDLPSPDAHAMSTTVQGGALRTYPFDPTVDSVEVLIRTDGRPLNARIELLQGPNNNKQVIELYTEDGCDRPFFCILETPGAGNVIRIVNTSPVEFPMTAGVVPHSINQEMASGAVLGGDVVIGGDVGW
jgi:hypothetical protein